MQLIKLPIKKVMLIDDDDDDSLVFKLALEEIDPAIEFHHHNCGDEAAAQIRSFQPDLLFLDINLPKISGIDCLRTIRQDPDCSRIPVVIYSSSELPRDLKEAYEAGATLYFRKPLDLPKLVACLRNIFQMAWHAPGEIQKNYSGDGRYLTF